MEEGDPMASASVSPTVGSGEKGQNSSHAKSGNSLMNFGEYQDWAHAEILRDKPNYASYICMESKDSSEAPRKFQEWATLKEYAHQADRRANHPWRN